LHRKSSSGVFAASYLIVYAFTCSIFLSLALIENGAYILEQQQPGYFNGAFYIYYVTALIGMLAFFFSLKHIKPINIKGTYKDDWLFLGISLICILSTIYIRFKYNPAGRFDFYVHSENRRFFETLETINAANFVWIMFRRPSRSLIWVVIFCFIAYLKFVTFSTYFGAVILMATIRLYHGYSISKKNLCFFITIIGLLLFYKSYILLNSERVEGFTLLARFVIAAHVWWGTVDLLEQGKAAFDFYGFFNDFFSFDMFKVNANYGLGELMYAITGNFALDFIEGGVIYSGGYPTILFYKFGWSAFFIHSIICFFYARMLNFKMLLANNYGLFIFFVAYKLLGQIDDFFFSGEYGYFKFKFILILVVLACFLLFIVAAKRISYCAKIQNEA
jgi:hypothetical protein